MVMNDFCQNLFRPSTTEQVSLYELFLRIRRQDGEPSRLKILRNLARTRHMTRTVYPPNWKFM